jgi:alanine-glyoxylate transaminase/serine-glyoxylate transaminase/serine-pyruvate transaminase
LELLVSEETHLPQLAIVQVPEGIDCLKVRHHLLNNHHLEVGAAFWWPCCKVWRIGLMCESSSAAQAFLFLSAFEGTLSEMQAQTPTANRSGSSGNFILIFKS